MNKLCSVLMLICLGLCGFGCSGKKQTNPLPNKDKLHLPNNREITLKNHDEIKIAKDFDLWAIDYFREPDPAAKTLWEIGIKQGHSK